MLLLTSTSDVLKLVTDSNANVDVHASWVDRSGTTDTPGRTNSAISSATTTTIVAAPASSTARNVRHLLVSNRHASTSVTVTVQHYDGTLTIRLINFVLLAGYSLEFIDDMGWVLIDASGARVETPQVGRYLGSTFLTSASSNFTTGPQTTRIRIRGVAGGGGGGGNTSVGSAAAACGGGGAGGYAEKDFTVTPNTAYAYTCGALGAGNSAAAGSDGANSTFVVGATTVTCLGGKGGPQKVAINALSVAVGGAGGLASTNGDINSSGQPGANGVVVIQATPIGASGGGGSSPFGGGGVGLVAAGNGVSGTGYGAGGSGSFRGAAAAGTGGSGTAGCWLVEEYS